MHSVTFNNVDITSQVTPAGMITTPVITGEHSTLFVTFEQSSDAINSPKQQASQARILGKEGGISVQNAQEGDLLQVYTPDGMLLHSQKLQAGQADIALDSKTLYIVKVADKVVKVRL